MFRDIDALVMWASVETADQYFTLKYFRLEVDSPILKGYFAIKGIKAVPFFLGLLENIFSLFKAVNPDGCGIDFDGLLISMFTLTISNHVDGSIACSFAKVERYGSKAAVPLQE